MINPDKAQASVSQDFRAATGSLPGSYTVPEVIATVLLYHIENMRQELGLPPIERNK